MYIIRLVFISRIGVEQDEERRSFEYEYGLRWRRRLLITASVDRPFTAGLILFLAGFQVIQTEGSVVAYS
jgi:hypothetical protein